ncbi:DNA-binding protein HU [Sulfitobacter noctilucae]|nr:DNA-binding protein HU [Sulfitobacter noctilucae]
MLRKKELVDLVVARAGMKKKDVKPVVESVLAVLGEALHDNRELNLQPLGRIKVRREKQLANGRMVVAKIRQPLAADPTAATDAPAAKPLKPTS